MKHLLPLYLALAISLSASAQEPTGNRGFRMPANGKRVVVYKLKGTSEYETLPRTLEDNLFFKIEDGVSRQIEGEDYGLIFVVPFANSTLESGMSCSEYTAIPYNRLWNCESRTRWWVKKSDLERALPSYDKWFKNVTFVAGALTLPTIARPRRGDTPFTLDADASLGTSAGIRVGVSEDHKRFLNLLGFAAIKSIKHDKNNNTGLTEDDGEIDGSGLAIGAGLSFDWDGVQTGVFFGCDKASGALGKDYVYQDALWIGFGIGVNIFTPSDAPKESDSQ